MTSTNPELQLAEDFVQHTNCTVFLTGKAGTGKTTFLHSIKKQTAKRLIVTAPTGVAAINAGGVTLHSFFQMPFGPFVPGRAEYTEQHRFSREKKNIIKSLDLLIIDEISMVRADLLDGVDTILRRHRRSDLPFGGVQLLMIGDLHQLAPVVKDDEWQLLSNHYQTPYFFSATALRRIDLVPIQLRHIYRQSDPTFIDLLNRVRDNRLDPTTLTQLNSRYQADFAPKDDEGYITLCTHNRQADAINEVKLRALPGKSRSFSADVTGEFPEYTYPTAADLELKTGAQVMFVRNDLSPEKRYFNGKIGRIAAMSSEIIEVDCPGDTATIEVKKSIWENIEYRVDPETTEISQKIIGTFNQYPLKAAWAITIHKSQGLTFDRAIIDAQAAFAHGQVYVALSRCRTFAGLVLSSPINALAVKTDPAVLHFVSQAENTPPTPDKLATAKIDYQQQLLLQCFDFSQLRRLLIRLAGLMHSHNALVQLLGGTDIDAVVSQAGSEISTVGDNFRRQLQGLFSATAEPAADPLIVERLAKASAYFQDKFATILTPCLERLEVETDNKEIRKKITDSLKWLREEAAVKLAAVRSCQDGFSPSRYLRALSAAALDTGQSIKKAEKVTATYSEADVGHPELFQSLREWRTVKAAAAGVASFQILHQKTLIQLAVNLPDSIAAFKKIHGIGPKMAEKYGSELVEMISEYRSRKQITTVTLPTPAVESTGGSASTAPSTPGEKAAKIDTKQLSLELFNSGKSINEIAKERGLTSQTIEGHLAGFIRNGSLSIDQALPLERRQPIEKTILAMPAKSLKEVKTALADRYSYGEIVLVQAHLKFCGKI